MANEPSGRTFFAIVGAVLVGIPLGIAHLRMRDELAQERVIKEGFQDDLHRCIRDKGDAEDALSRCKSDCD